VGASRVQRSHVWRGQHEQTPAEGERGTKGRETRSDRPINDDLRHGHGLLALAAPECNYRPPLVYYRIPKTHAPAVSLSPPVLHPLSLRQSLIHPTLTAAPAPLRPRVWSTRNHTPSLQAPNNKHHTLPQYPNTHYTAPLHPA
jgi:hypothetical protein